jgi:hypothetical protein
MGGVRYSDTELFLRDSYVYAAGRYGVLKYRVKVKAILVSRLSLLALSRAYLYQQSWHQTVHKVPSGFQNIAGLRQIELDTCTLLWLVFRLPKVLTYFMTPQCGHPW